MFRSVGLLASLLLAGLGSNVIHRLAVAPDVADFSKDLGGLLMSESASSSSIHPAFGHIRPYPSSYIHIQLVRIAIHNVCQSGFQGPTGPASQIFGKNFFY